MTKRVPLDAANQQSFFGGAPPVDGPVFAPGEAPAPAMTPNYDVLEVSSDGGSRGNPGPAAIGAVVVDPSSDPPQVLAEVSECIGVATNNVAEYKALIAGIDAAAALGARRLVVRADSLLVIEQVRGRYKVKHPALKPLAAEAQRKLGAWAHVELRHVPREENTEADALVNRALDATQGPAAGRPTSAGRSGAMPARAPGAHRGR